MVCSDHIDEAHFSPDTSRTCCLLFGNPTASGLGQTAALRVSRGRAHCVPSTWPELGAVRVHVERMDGLVPRKDFSPENTSEHANVLLGRGAQNLFLRSFPESSVLRHDLLGLKNKRRGSP